MMIISEETPSARGETAMPQTQAASVSEHEMCGLGQSTISLEGLLPLVIRAKLPGRNQVIKYSPLLSAGQGSLHM